MNLFKKIGIGTAQFGSDYGISNIKGQVSLIEISDILSSAKSLGIEYIDTAYAYGDAENRLGNFDINNFKVISKYLPSRDNMDIGAQLNSSLKRLNLISIYAYMSHRPKDLIDNPLKWEQFNNLKSMGKVAKIGYSLNTVPELDILLDKRMYPDIIQVPYNIFDNRFEKYMVDLKKNNCEIHVRSVFLQGLFFLDTEKMNPFFDSVKSTIKELQLKYGQNLSNMLLNYVLNKDFVDVTVIGIETKDQLLQNVEKVGLVNNDEYCRYKISENILQPFMWPK